MGVKFSKGSADSPFRRESSTSFQGWLDVSRLGLATVNLQTKFEVSNYTHYEDMRSSAKCTNWGSLGHLGVTQRHR